MVKPRMILVSAASPQGAGVTATRSDLLRTAAERQHISALPDGLVPRAA
jgi:hypothetical protein